MAFVQCKSDVDQIAEEENYFLQNDVLVDLEGLESLVGGKDGF